MTNETSSIGLVVGENLKRLRIAAGESQAECAQRLRSHGLDWARNHVASLETDRRATITVEELVILAWAYKTTPAELFAGDGLVALTPALDAERETLRSTLGGKKTGPRAATAHVIDFSNVVELEADERVASRLGVDTEVVTRIARERWGHTLTDERNRRLADAGTKDPRALRTLRGGMTKRLMREVEQHVQEAGGGE